MMKKKWQSLILCSFVLLILGLSAGVVALSFAGVSIVPVSEPVSREQPASLNVAFSAYGDKKEELEPSILYDRALRQTVYLSWSENSGNGKGQSISASGVIVSDDGYILTNAHCVIDAKEAGDPMRVELYDGRTFVGRIVGADTETDVALLKIETTGLSAATLSTAKLKGCQKIYAMGHPSSELKFTITCGIISGLNRRIDMDESCILNMIQIDAPVNPGNSGGPLYDAYGSVIGIVTAKYMSLDTEGLGFAIPIQDALTIAADLKEYGYVKGRPLMGITAIGVAANNLRPGSPAGVMVHSATEGLPGAQTGLRKGDIIVSINGETVENMTDLTRIKDKYKAGDTVKMRIWRDNEYFTVSLTFAEATPDYPTGPVKIEEETEEAGGQSEAPADGAGENAAGNEEDTGKSESGDDVTTGEEDS